MTKFLRLDLQIWVIVASFIHSHDQKPLMVTILDATIKYY